MLRPLSSLGLVGVALLGLGCTGTIDGAVPGAGGGPGAGNDPNKDPGTMKDPVTGKDPNKDPVTGEPPPANLPTDEKSVPGMAPLRRLTRLEYENTVRDLLGIPVPATRLATFSVDQESSSSGFVRGGAITAPPDARVFMLAAEEMGVLALPKVGSLVPCPSMPSGAGEEESCADKFIKAFGRRAYRRPLTQAESDDLRGVYKALRQAPANATFPQAISSLITAMLQSPYFLYRWELGPNPATKDGDLVRFNQHEVASRLSYLFWASMPDDRLFAAADGGSLGSPDQVAAEARRLLNDPRAKEGLMDFHLQWLAIGTLTDLPKDPSLTDYSPEVARSMLKETREFLSSVFQGPKADGKLQTLLTSPASFVDGTLAKIYGLGNVSGADPQAVSFDAAKRAGLLTQGTFLTAKADAIDSHPIKRGDTVLNKVLCIPLEVPNDIMVPPLPEPKPGQTTRERVASHSEAACATCHKMIDPIGFAFENYDAIARYRTMEEGKPVDASGSIQLGNDTISFKNAIEMLPKLAQSQEARECMVTMWWRYALRRQEVKSEEPSLHLVREAFRLSGHDLRELLVAFTRTRGFTHRKPSLEEVLQ